ncbi:MAG TPA: outer membrane lipoprotein-sorting protein [Acidobacteriota bacterium]|nr:outer membrane lipoprotein-sorting protein [Acidobacteriota bacterium]
MQLKLFLPFLLFAPLLCRSTPAVSLSLDELLSRLAQSNKRRDALLAGYVGIRVYEASNGFTHSHAQMHVKVVFRNPSSKDLTVVSEDGSKVIRSRVFKPALSAEKEALRADLKQRSAISPENYEFTLVGEEDLRERHCYVLEARPRRKDKFLLRGRVWIDSVDYAVIRVQGELVKLPSFWTRKVEYARDYQKIGDFWLPMRDESVSQLLIFGRSTLSITYSDYQIEVRSAGGVAAGDVQLFKQR